MKIIRIDTNKIVKYIWLFNGLVYFKIREDWREHDLKREIYENIKSGDFQYKV